MAHTDAFPASGKPSLLKTALKLIRIPDRAVLQTPLTRWAVPA